MSRTVTSDVSVDARIAEILTQPQPVPFPELLARAQKAIDWLSKSVFFRRFIEETIEAFSNSQFLTLARAVNAKGEESLVLTTEYRLKFRFSDDAPLLKNLCDYADCDHDPILISEAGNRLERMQTVDDTMRYLIDCFGQPSFTAEDVARERTRNGTVRLTVFNDPSGEHNDSLLHIATDRLRDLQFKVESRALFFGAVTDEDYHLGDIGQDLFIMNCNPVFANAVRNFYERLSPNVKKRLLIVAYKNYEHCGFTTEILAHPRLYPTCELDDTALLALLDQMFDD